MVPLGIFHHLYKQSDEEVKMAGNNPIKIFTSVLSHYINLNTNLLKYNRNALITNYFRMCSLRHVIITKIFIPP